MRILLPLHPDFLRSTFPRTRYTLEGKWHKVIVPQTETFVHHAEVELFSGSQLKTSILSDQSELLVKTAPRIPDKTTSFSLVLKAATQVVLSVVIGLSMLVALVLFVPDLYYRIFPTSNEIVSLTDSQKALTSQQVVAPEEAPTYLPPKDETLPEGSWLIIPRIGVRTELQRTETAEEALQTGVWQAPDFGEPGDTQKPVILAAHRYGWKWWWQSEYWKYHSFYLLPDTQPGDRIEIIYDQRKWVYEIYAVAEGSEIEDYSADVILYTCKFLNSDARYIRYARLINPEESTQSLTNTMD